jgi:hypothetical protein
MVPTPKEGTDTPERPVLPGCLAFNRLIASYHDQGSSAKPHSYATLPVTSQPTPETAPLRSALLTGPGCETFHKVPKVQAPCETSHTPPRSSLNSGPGPLQRDDPC